MALYQIQVNSTGRSLSRKIFGLPTPSRAPLPQVHSLSSSNSVSSFALSPLRYRLTHVHLGEEAKEQVKEVLHMRTVPFYVVVGKVSG